MQHTFRATHEDEKVLNALCSHLELSLAEAVRHSIRHTARHYGIIAPKKKLVLKIDLEEVITRETPVK